MVEEGSRGEGVVEGGAVGLESVEVENNDFLGMVTVVKNTVEKRSTPSEVVGRTMESSRG